MYRFVFVLGVSLLVMMIGACDNKTNKANEYPLAEVYGKRLYPADIKDILGEGISKTDSAMIVNAYIEDWAKSTLLTTVASNNIPDNVNINKLVEDYRASLILHTYQQALINERLDSVVAEEEIVAYYNKTKNEQKIQSTIIRCYFIKVSAAAPNLDNLRKWWKEKEPLDYDRMMDYCNKYAEIFSLNDSTWVERDDLAAIFPAGSLKDIKANMEIVETDDEFLYFSRIYEIVTKGKTAPMSAVREKAIHFILHKRKKELLENMADELYLREQKRGKVKIHIPISETLGGDK